MEREKGESVGMKGREGERGVVCERIERGEKNEYERVSNERRIGITFPHVFPVGVESTTVNSESWDAVQRGMKGFWKYSWAEHSLAGGER